MQYSYSLNPILNLRDSGYRVGSYVKAVVKTSSPESLRSGESRHVSIQLLREIDEDSNKGILSFGAKRDFSALMPGHRLKGKITWANIQIRD